MEKDKIVFKGSHPDSLYRVPVGSGIGASKVVRVLRILRWPVALFTVCIALAVFVYFLMPDNISSDVDTVNATDWQENNAIAQTRRVPSKPTRKPPDSVKHTTKSNLRAHGTKPQEIDFYDAENVKTIDLTSLMETITEKNEKIKIPVPPVFPKHITPEVQYGNEKADTEKIRTPKLLETANANNDDSTLKPHITQSPERPLAIYFDEGKVAASTETITRAETNNDILHYDEKDTTRAAEEMSSKPYSPVYKDSSLYVRKENSNYKQQPIVPGLPQEIHNYYRLTPLNPDNRFTSGHSKLFGISIEDAERMKSTTQSSLYNTRVSPTLPTWRDRADSTTKNYPLNVNLDVSQCRSTRLALCRGVLPYDLAGPAVTLDGSLVTELLPQIEYLVSTNCSDRTAQFLCALLEPECSPAPYLHRMPCYNLCRAVAESCEGSIPRELSGVFGCTRYPTSSCSAPRSPCGLRELACNDGSCVPRHWACDGAADCPSAEDEAHCTACAHNEFRCNSGGCIRTRWVCDGYSDCPGGEDEAEQVCGTRGREADEEQVADADSEPGEESAGSAPALAVRRPYHGPDSYADDSIHRTGESESSKELLMTSDSNNGLKHNFTRRPSPARLTPYQRPIINDYKVVRNDKVDTTVKRKANERKTTTTTPPTTTNHVSDETTRETTMTESLGAHLDKSINNLEQVINGAAMLKKTSEAVQEDIGDSSESKIEIVDKTEEPRSHRGTGRYDDAMRAHASPCPSGELRCVDGRCITLAQLCDGTIDCSDHADEDNCYT
ncbi:atrial natriuretic peptide-converting enzyme [Battus philenor]|uniref:atrial natriuretic peptide-converting enzyme n=1 Tax=Battus philenor TaxID=42288 RepID=UPI0035CF159D